MHARRSASGPRTAAHVALTVGLLVVAVSVGDVLAYLMSASSGSIAAFTVARTLLAVVLVLLVVSWRAAAGQQHGLPALAWTGVPAALAYLLVPSAWTGAALFWWQVLDRGAVTWLLDLVVWLLLVGLGMWWGSSRTELRAAPATPYG